jgi:hypothetical protein
METVSSCCNVCTHVTESSRSFTPNRIVCSCLFYMLHSLSEARGVNSYQHERRFTCVNKADIDYQLNDASFVFKHPSTHFLFSSSFIYIFLAHFLLSSFILSFFLSFHLFFFSSPPFTYFYLTLLSTRNYFVALFFFSFSSSSSMD